MSDALQNTVLAHQGDSTTANETIGFEFDEISTRENIQIASVPFHGNKVVVLNGKFHCQEKEYRTKDQD